MLVWNAAPGSRKKRFISLDRTTEVHCDVPGCLIKKDWGGQTLTESDRAQLT